MSRVKPTIAAVVAIALILGGGALAATAKRQDNARSATVAPGALPKACTEAVEGTTTEIATAKLIIEYNSTDRDMGVHGAFDDHGWSALCVFDPGGRPVLEVGPQGQLRDLTMAGIFFESREPPASEFSYADLKAAFPEGAYTVRGRSYDGTTLVGTAIFTHDVPAPPKITSPALADEPRGTRRNPVSLDGLVIDWDRVRRTIARERADITGYEVIVMKENHDDPNGLSRPIYDVHVPAGVTRLSVAPEFLEPGAVYELEVLAREVSGNQTISVGFFRTA